MPASRISVAVALAALTLAVVAPAASAADYTWVPTWAPGGSSTVWSNGANWQGGVAPSGTVGTISFPLAPCSSSPQGCGYFSMDDVQGLTASTLSIAAAAPGTGNYVLQALQGTSDKPLTLSSGMAVDNQGSGLLQFGVPLVLSAANSWILARGALAITGGIAGAAPLDVQLTNTSYSPIASINFWGTSNEVGPVSITGALAGANPEPLNTVVLGGFSGEPGDLNGTNGNPVVLKDLRFSGSGTLGALSTSNVRFYVTRQPAGAAAALQVASATFEPHSSLVFAVTNPSGSTPGVDWSEITSSGDIDLGGAALGLFFPEDECPAMGATYTLIATTGALTGSAAPPGNNNGYSNGCGPRGDYGQARVGWRFTYNRTGSTKTVTATIEPADAWRQPVSPPTVTGDATEGQTLTATYGTWRIESGSHTSSWLRCETTDPETCEAIERVGNTTSYVLTSADVGKRVRFRDAPACCRPEVSAPTEVVKPAPAPGPGPGPTTTQVNTALRTVGAPAPGTTVRSVLKKGATLTFRAPSAGKLAVAWSRNSTVASSRNTVVAKGARTVTERGKVKLVVRLTKAGKRLLRAARQKKRALELTSKVSFTPTGAARTTRRTAFRLKP